MSMHSTKIVVAMIDNGFVNAELDAPPDYLLFTSRAVHELETALQSVKADEVESVTEVVAAMFDNGYCNRKGQPDPVEWINYAVQAIKSLQESL